MRRAQGRWETRRTPTEARGKGREAMGSGRDRTGLSGLDVCRTFRSLSEERRGYFILLTDRPEGGAVTRALDAGADDVLIRPIGPPDLRARVMAGERFLVMQRELTQKNKLITETLDVLRQVHALIDKDLIEAKKFQQSLLRQHI